jgi:hypothetical protein
MARNHQYLSRSTDRYVVEKDKVFIPGLREASWDYVKSRTKDDLEEDLAYLASLLL